mmetsp:Transcript_42034/g.67594  ORF Transcript_42034/g.67594 Transcript_42034/m.67594 type:complete len:82 (+) Transcript_42034:522-767(+)
MAFFPLHNSPKAFLAYQGKHLAITLIHLHFEILMHQHPLPPTNWRYQRLVLKYYNDLTKNKYHKCRTYSLHLTVLLLIHAA